MGCCRKRLNSCKVAIGMKSTKTKCSYNGFLSVKRCHLLSGPFVSKTAGNRNDLRNTVAVSGFLNGMKGEQILNLSKLKFTQKSIKSLYEVDFVDDV